MNRPTSQRRWLQFRLRTLLLLALLVALGLGGWQYWRQTRHIWRLQWAIAEYLPADSEEAILLRALAWNREAWDSGLIDAFGGRSIARTNLERALLWFEGRPKLRWFGTFGHEDGSLRRIYLFEHSSTPAPTWPLTCLVTDAERRPEMWLDVAKRNQGFDSATVDEGAPPVLRIQCRRWFAGSVRYDYQITKGRLHLVDEVECGNDESTVEDVRAVTAN